MGIIITTRKGFANKFTNFNSGTSFSIPVRICFGLLSINSNFRLYENVMCTGCINVGVNFGTLPCQAVFLPRLCANRVLGIFGHNREGVARMEENTQ